MVGTEGDNTIQGTPSADVIVGLGGNDSISGGGGNDLICGQRGNDDVEGEDGDDKVSGGRGNDLVVGEFSELDGSGNDLLVGNEGSDVLVGGPLADVMQGGDGNDRLEGDYGSDAMDGGVGSDTVVFPYECGTADLAAGNAAGPEGADTLTAVENLEGPDFNNFDPTSCTFYGDEGPNRLLGGVSSDVMRGRGGADDLDGRQFGGGIDQLFGNRGPDALDVADGAGGDVANGGVGSDACQADAGDTVTNCE